MFKQILSALLLITLYNSIYARTDEATSTSSELKKVTIYQSGAEMIHTASALLKEGNSQLVIENISNQLDINSIQIKAPASVTIMGVEFSNNYLAPAEKTPRIKMLEDSLAQIKKEIEKIDLLLTNNKDLLDVLKTNRDIKGSQTGLSVTELMKLMDYYKSKSLELQSEQAQLTEKKKKTAELLNKIQNQITTEERKNTSSAGRLVLQLSATNAGKQEFTISYIAQNAYWTPSYDIKLENTQQPLKLIYKAKVVQTTGLDWKKVKLSLSTAMPSQWGNAPILSSWFLSYINPVFAMNKSLQSSNMIQSLSGKAAGVAVMDKSEENSLEDVVVTGYGTQRQSPLYIVNGSAMSQEEFSKIRKSSIKSMTVLKDESATSIYGSRAANGVVMVTLNEGLEEFVSVADNTLDLTFDIDLPMDIPSNGKEQTATLKVMDIPANFKHYAVPKLDKDAYLLAEVPGWEKLNLLPGSANIILEGTYVGKSFIDPNSTQDTLNLTLGKDKRVIIKREKMNDFSSTKFLGSSKLQKFTYQVTVRNTKNEVTNILLKDQFPLSTMKEIEVELVDAGGAEVKSEIGVLNWRLSLQPNETRTVRFSYTVRYAKDRTLNLN